MRVFACLVVALVALFAAPASRAAVPGTRDVTALLHGIPQHGAWLGDAKAPLVMVEYVDLQCPYCAVLSLRTLPSIVKSHVRTGRVRILFRGLAFVGPDSTTAARWAYGAAAQNRLWHVVELLFANQGAENRGWVTSPLLANVARSVPGLDLARLRRDADRAGTQLETARTAAQLARVSGTPFLQIGRSLATLQPLKLRSFEPKDLAAQIDAFR